MYLHTYIGYLKNIYLVCMDVTWASVQELFLVIAL